MTKHSTHRPLAATLTGISLLTAAAFGAPTRAMAVEVDATEFFAGCPQIFLSEETTVTGKATIVGDCNVSVEASVPFELVKARIETSGALYLHGLSSRTSLHGAKITADGDISIDSRGTVDIVASKITSNLGRINVPPSSDILIERSTLSAASDLTLGGSGGTTTAIKSKLLSSATVNIAKGASGTTGTSLDSTKIIAGSTIHVGGSNAIYTFVKSSLVAAGTINLSPSGLGTSAIQSSSLFSAGSTIYITGAGSVEIVKSKIASDIAAGMLAIQIAGGGSRNVTDSKISASEGYIQFYGGGSTTLQGASVDAAGADGNGRGVALASGSGVTSVVDSKLLARTGTVAITTGGAISVSDSVLDGRGAVDSATLGGAMGVQFGCGGTIDVTSSQIKGLAGGVLVATYYPITISATKILTKGDGGVLITGGTDAEVTESNILAGLGNVRILQGGGINVDLVKAKTGGDLGMLMESGINVATGTEFTRSTVKGPALAARSYGPTTATDNKLGAIAGDIEFSSAASCSSINNKPDVPCL
jgi:hypothetical protein